MKKEITMVENIGWYHPSNTNWSYRTHLIIDDTGARMYKENFGGDSRLRAKMEKEGYKVTRYHVGKGGSVEAKYKDIKELSHIESYTGKNY